MDKVLEAVNENPHKLLNCDRRQMEIECEGEKYRIVPNRMKGGIEVFVQGKIIHLTWDKNQRKWIR